MERQQTKEGQICPACGAPQRPGGEASACTLCGKLLREGYFPLDNLRASYRGDLKPPVIAAAAAEPEALFAENKNGASETAWAFTVYSMVPYLGILFCPGAVLMGGLGIFASRRNPKLGGERISRISIIAGLLILLFQIFLWWLLYIIPTLKR